MKNLVKHNNLAANDVKNEIMMEEMAELRQEIAGETSEKLTKKSIN